MRLLKEQLRMERIRYLCPSAEGLSDAQLSLLGLEPSVSLCEVLAESVLCAEIKAGTPMPEPSRSAQESKSIGSQAASCSPGRVETVIHCSEADCQCAQCGGEKKGHRLRGQRTVEHQAARILRRSHQTREARLSQVRRNGRHRRAGSGENRRKGHPLQYAHHRCAHREILREKGSVLTIDTSTEWERGKGGKGPVLNGAKLR